MCFKSSSKRNNSLNKLKLNKFSIIIQNLSFKKSIKIKIKIKIKIIYSGIEIFFNFLKDDI